MAKKKLSKKQQADLWYQQNKGQIDWSVGANRKKFRESSYWIDFVKKYKKSYCEQTGIKGKMTLHHLDEKNYDNLDPKNFKTLNWTVHKTVHQIDRRKDQSNTPEFWFEFMPSKFKKS